MSKKFPKLHYNETNIDDVWEADLCQLTSLKDENDGFSYLLIVIDVLSKFVWIEPLRDKTAQGIPTALEEILKRANGRVPQCLQTYKGKEFIGSAVQRVLKRHAISFRTARNLDI